MTARIVPLRPRLRHVDAEYLIEAEEAAQWRASLAALEQQRRVTPPSEYSPSRYDREGRRLARNFLIGAGAAALVCIAMIVLARCSA
ncbi:MAG: hypothetical protein QM702_00110 [Rubrivivax sp.]